MSTFGKWMSTSGIALVSVGAIAIAPTSANPSRPVDRSLHLAAATSPTAVQEAALQQPLAEQTTNVLGALLSLDLGKFIIPPSLGQPFPTPQLPGPTPTPNEFEDAIINTYHAIEPWVRYGFELGTYAVGWVPWVGWLSPQIMIFYNFGERIVESLVVNSANWLWGPLPFGEGLSNVARDSWNALVQLGRDEWNFWLPPLPPLPFTAQQAQEQSVTAETLAAAEATPAPSNTRPHPLRDLLAAVRHSLVDADPITPHDVDPAVSEPAVADATVVAGPANPGEEPPSQADVPQPDVPSATPQESETDPPAGKPHRFRLHPRASETPTETANEPVSEQNSPVRETGSAGKVDPQKNPKKHRFTDAHRARGAKAPAAA
ncbi:hypothetical protein [Mycolicibacterium psychrotolerans]|uniref:PE family protein n=1 Tax=Mycolicibacterium psychrotolerans TaxID=216929 RepID=A0A7I7MHE5_9MYCO|nr:hypothetical protein [Mycolicibacterium psychrotolerans]BBX71197.1 hypothetical protein MPSYJ_46580 [Mycolicibacterium psychrotolerans]